MAEETRMRYGIEVDDASFAYLRLQKGKLDQYASDRAEWHRRYENDLKQTYEEIAPYLPETCESILDVGSGLGGIDILLSRHYRGEAAIALLDGESDPPEMKLHRETFNDMRVAAMFHVANGVSLKNFSAHTPHTKVFAAGYDLVVSFGSWCFHYPPSEYMDRVVAAMRPGGRLIVDIRHGRGWPDQIWRAGFRSLECVRDTEKYQRVVWVRK